MPSINLPLPPNWNPNPPRPQPEPVVPVSVVNEHPKLDTIQATIPGADEPVAISYGRQQVGGRVFALDYSPASPDGASTFTVGYSICEGEIEEVTSVWINGAAAVSGVGVNTYVGNAAAQLSSPDALLSAAIAGYSDDLTWTDPVTTLVSGIAYGVIQYQTEDYGVWPPPQVIFEIKGRLTDNPRNLLGEKIMLGNNSRTGTLAAGIDLTGATVALLLYYEDNAGVSPLDFTILSNYGGAGVILSVDNAGVLTGGGMVTDLKVDGDTYAGAALTDGYCYRVTFTCSSGTLGLIGPLGLNSGIAFLRIRRDGKEWRYDLTEGTGNEINNSAGRTGAAYDGTWDTVGWSGDKTTTNQPSYTQTPALHLADFDSNAELGNGLTVDRYGWLELQDANDEKVDNSPTEKRRRGGITFSTVRPKEEIARVLAAYAGAFRFRRGDKIVYVPDRPADPVRHLFEEDIVRDSLAIEKLDSSQLPTAMRASYSDDTEDIWVERYCTEVTTSGASQRRAQQFRNLGSRWHSQSYREAEERLARLERDLKVSWVMFDDGMELEPGDIVTLTHSTGNFVSKHLRIIDMPVQVSPGRWRIVAWEYDASDYSDSVVAA